MFAALRGPKKMVAVPDAGHELLLTDTPGPAWQAVGDFLFQVTPVP